MKVFSVAEMVAVEKAADAAGISYDQMMESAGRGVAEAIESRRSMPGTRVLVLVGPGNNGGDGLVAGRYLAKVGVNVTFYLYRPRDRERDHNYALIQKMGLTVVDARSDRDFGALRAELHNADIVIDALLGTGVIRAIGGELAGLMEQVKRSIARRSAAEGRAFRNLVSIAQIGNGPGITRLLSLTDDTSEPNRSITPPPFVVAVDCPSGLNCDTGELDPLAIPAHMTVTFAGPKRGHFRFPGAAACGELVVADIGVPPDLPQQAQVRVALTTAGYARDLLPPRPADGHKGTFGTVIIASGSSRYWGAPVLAARASYRIGAGLVALVVPESIRPTTAAQLPEATYPPVLDQDVLGSYSARWMRQEVKAEAMLIGPGIGDAHEFLTALLGTEGGTSPLPPMVVDADGLNILAGKDDWHHKLPPRTILTPHPGEMARLMGISLADLKGQDRVAVAQEQSARWGHVVLLKGAYTVIAEPDGSTHILPFAKSILSTAGSGDVLAGTIAGLIAQGLATFEAAVLGGYLHAAAGQLASEAIGEAGLLAGEIADLLPFVRKRLLVGEQK